MRRYLRCWTMIVCVCFLAVSMTSCMTYVRFQSVLDDMIEDAYREENTKGDGEPSHEEAEEEQQPFPLTYDLSEADRDGFYDQLELCRSLTLEGTDETAIDAAWEELEDQYYHIATQSQIAYIYYCTDQSDEELSDAYLYSTEMSSEVYAAYMALCQEIDQSDSPARDYFFEDWTEEEMEEMRNYNKESSELDDKNAELLVEFRALSEKEFESGAAKIFYEMVQNNARIAELAGYEDYYTYAYDKIYNRDYGKSESQILHQEVAKQIFPLLQTISQRFAANFDGLNSIEKSFVQSVLLSPYDDLRVNYVKNYVNSLPTSAKESMESMFETGNSYFANSKNASDIAFTVMLYEFEQPFCYFGPNSQTGSTVIHELGHYYAEHFFTDEGISMDLAEVHSQANEMLFLVYLKEHISEKLYNVIVDYSLLNLMAMIVMCVVIDEFEMRVYQSYDEITNPERQLDEIMNDVLESYGGYELFSQLVTDPYSYWRHVTIESPVYYVSYAVSAIASVQLYASAIDDYDGAMETYILLVEQANPADGFLAALETAGILSPFHSEGLDVIAKAIERK